MRGCGGVVDACGVVGKREGCVKEVGTDCRSIYCQGQAVELQGKGLGAGL